jgi:hypothetical protein
MNENKYLSYTDLLAMLITMAGCYAKRGDMNSVAVLKKVIYGTEKAIIRDRIRTEDITTCEKCSYAKPDDYGSLYCALTGDEVPDTWFCADGVRKGGASND